MTGVSERRLSNSAIGLDSLDALWEYLNEHGNLALKNDDLAAFTNDPRLAALAAVANGGGVFLVLLSALGQQTEVLETLKSIDRTLINLQDKLL